MFPSVIVDIIEKYCQTWQLLPWIPEEKIDWDGLSKNPHDEALALLKANPEKINWDWLSENPHDEALKLLKTNSPSIEI